jgi:hypothetical protein
MFKKLILTLTLKPWSRYLGIGLACLIFWIAGTPAHAQFISNTTSVELLPVADGYVWDIFPLDGVGDVVEDSIVTLVVSLIPGFAETHGVMEFDLTSIGSGGAIHSATLEVIPVGLGVPSGASTVPVELFGFLGDGSIQTDDFNAGSTIAIFNLSIPVRRVPVPLDVTEFLQNEPLLEFVGFNLRTNLDDAQANFGSLEFGSTSTLIVELAVVQVDIDIKPGGDPNSMNCTNENGVLPVAILTTENFDATTVDHTTVTFEGASETHVNKNSGEPRRHEQDVDNDGDADLLFHFRLGDMDFTCGSTEGTLTGETFDGQLIQGTDTLNPVPPFYYTYYTALLNDPDVSSIALTFGLLSLGLLAGLVLIVGPQGGWKRHRGR